ncbi:MAG: hypothetical protein IJC64_02755 [Clostridia bacterium]|nr:hypothetical protein [Clostridia bacterium]
MARGVSQKTKKLTLGAVLCALGVVLLSIGSLIQTVDLSAAALASFLCIFAVIELGGAYPWAIYVVTGLLSVILSHFGMAGWFYIAFFGYYPMIKEKVERLSRPVSWLIKMLTLNVALFLCVVISYFLVYASSGKGLLDAFMAMFGDGSATEIFAVIMVVLVNAVFVIYDIALTRIISLYINRLRHRFRFLR